jgi:hypothetical protein
LWVGFYKHVAPLALEKGARASARFNSCMTPRAGFLVAAFGVRTVKRRKRRAPETFGRGMRVRGMTLCRNAGNATQRREAGTKNCNRMVGWQRISSK